VAIRAIGGRSKLLTGKHLRTFKLDRASLDGAGKTFRSGCPPPPSPEEPKPLSEDECSQRIRQLRHALHRLFRLESPEAWAPAIGNLYVSIQWFTRFASKRQSTVLLRFSRTLEKYVAELSCSSHRYLSANSRPLVPAIDLLILLSQAPHALSRGLEHMRVLVLEEVTSSRLEIVQAMEDAGVRAIGESESAKALRLLTEQRFTDAIVSAARDPNLEFCRSLRKLPQGRDVRLMTINRPANLEYMARSTAVGVSDSVPNSISPAELVLRVLSNAVWTEVWQSQPLNRVQSNDDSDTGRKVCSHA
jgi:CheY-like chemotaxis protein